MLRLALLALCLAATGASAQTSDYGAWRKKNTDGSWTRFAEEAVRNSTLPQSKPSDITKFCPSYEAKSEAERVQFWAGLLSIIARLESNFNPAATYTESFADSQGNKVVSRGLLQISIESANQKRYSCGIKKAEDLHDPKTNLTCGVRILDAWVKADAAIATPKNQNPIGGGRYWSTLREKSDPKRNHLPEITNFTRALPVCAAT
jgi:hypothetical protein